MDDPAIVVFTKEMHNDVMRVFAKHGYDLDDGDAIYKGLITLQAHFLALLKSNGDIGENDIKRLAEWGCNEVQALAPRVAILQAQFDKNE